MVFPQFTELWRLIDLLGGSLSAYIVFQENNEIIYLKNYTA
jgi:hypothetical protein